MIPSGRAAFGPENCYDTKINWNFVTMYNVKKTKKQKKIHSFPSFHQQLSKRVMSLDANLLRDAGARTRTAPVGRSRLSAEERQLKFW